MHDVVIENPVINSAFAEPSRYFKFTDDGITNEIVDGRRPSAYFVPVPPPKKKGQQLELGTEWTKDRLKPNDEINEIRAAVGQWRQRDYPGVTHITRRLLDYWQRPDRDRRLFFCQLEAAETAIFLTEYAPRLGNAYLLERLREINAAANLGLPRKAFKMATGSGKTVVMAMLIAWQALNKLESPRDARFGDSFLIVTPGITIRDRLRVLLPNDADNYYRQLDVVPVELMERLNQASIVVTNFHAFLLRETVQAGTLTKKILAGRNAQHQSPFTETPDQMVRRVCREFGGKRNIVAINDEAHHCYRSKPAETADEGAAPAVKLKGDERKEAERRDEEARVWISGLEAVDRKIGLRAVYDLSATPFFLRGSGYPEGRLFPWVVSDFSLVDAIECGIVKVPRVPVADNSMSAQIPMYRHLWPHVRDSLPKKGRKTEDIAGGMPMLPKELQGALETLYENYEKYHEAWRKAAEEAGDGSLLTPPVFIVVCNNTNVSKLVFDWIAGWELTIGEGDEAKRIIATGNLKLFSNASFGRWSARPNTILIDSSQLESGEAMSPEFKKVATREIVEFKTEYRERFPASDPEKLTDEDLLREVMNTVGKPGRLGEQVRCVVSVSMLTEGWDANTVTHVLGVRAFSTQLLCEQVIGRALRRTTYVTDEGDMFPAEYAEVYGVPFSFIPVGPIIAEPVLPKKATRVRALPERVSREITFPRLTGYRYELSGEKLEVGFDEHSGMSLSTEQVPTKVDVEPLIGLKDVHTLDQLKARRDQEVDFLLAKLVYEKYFCGDDAGGDGQRDRRPWLFPQILEVARRWRRERLTCKDDCFPQMLLLIEYAHTAADKIYRAIVDSSPGVRRLLPILQPYDTVGSTSYIEFDTTRPVWATRADKCHISHVVCDTESWEQKMAQTLEDMDEVEAYVKNHNLGFTIPYTFEGEQHGYVPDFIVRLRAPEVPAGSPALNLIIEVSGEAKKEKAAKVETARTLWVPAVNNHGGFGRWGFIEISDPWDAKNTIRATIRAEVMTT
ncbi:MAG TPA: DEAD/DEAH box helicase family protein [Thermoleophilia bacterium]|nr:DEAD/DEAH box helicase family protein [Thermoleophilia bacterium]